MSGIKPLLLIGWAVVCLTACSPGPGDTCKAAADCPGNLCLSSKDGFADGYCSADCSTASCTAGQSCKPVANQNVCLVKCTDAAACRAGYQCFEGVCQPSCKTDAACGLGYVCKNATCEPRPGAKNGASCGADGDCSSTACVNSVCLQVCDRDADCAGGATCALDRDALTLRAVCVPRRSGGVDIPEWVAEVELPPWERAPRDPVAAARVAAAWFSSRGAFWQAAREARSRTGRAG